MNEKLHILLVEDDEDDFVMARDLLSDAFGSGYHLHWVHAPEAARQAVRANGHDVYLIDQNLGAVTGIEILREAVGAGCPAPIIMLTGDVRRETDMEAMQIGAADYLVKSDLSAPLLERSIRYAIERKKTEQRLATLAWYDSLTGLANRALFHERLREALAQAGRTKRPVALLLLDLDRFKEVNDTFGHPAGDALLQGVAERLREPVRETDLVARLSGDEFAVIATNLRRREDAAVLAGKLVSRLAAPFGIDDQVVYTGASVGIALCSDDALDPSGLLKCADVALYQAKQYGRGRFRFYDRVLDERVQEQKRLEQELCEAIQSEALFLEYQPKVDISSSEVIGAEALVRWRHPQRGVLQPGEFIPLAERTGLISSIGEWVLQAACRQIAEWRADGGCAFSPRVAVNLSPRQITDADFPARVEAILRQYGLVGTDALELEVTETVLMENAGVSMHCLAKLAGLGVSLSLDDFGTGYSSLAYLKRMPVRLLKIDRSFVRDMDADPNDAAIVRAVIVFAHSLGLKVVAEGVETEGQLAFLRRHGCDLAQGFYFSRPVSSADVCRLMKSGIEPARAPRSDTMPVVEACAG